MTNLENVIRYLQNELGDAAMGAITFDDEANRIASLIMALLICNSVKGGL